MLQNVVVSTIHLQNFKIKECHCHYHIPYNSYLLIESIKGSSGRRIPNTNVGTNRFHTVSIEAQNKLTVAMSITIVPKSRTPKPGQGEN
jgi:hypothetical protein